LLTNKSGFIFLETLIAFTIVLISVSLILPTTVFIATERQKLSDRQMIITKLHDIIQPYIYQEQLNDPKTLTEHINGKAVQLTMSLEGKYIKGCAKWTDVKKKPQTFCLYAFPAQ